MQQYIIGIDTGGTCTDASLISNHSGNVLATAKTPTTHHRLSDGISSVLSNLLTKSKIAPDQICGVSISTTLATNSVVEKKGARVGIFVIGYVKHFKLPVTAVIFLKGGHTIQGVEEEPLELEYLVETLTKIKPSVDAYAVCSAMSMKNPAHELVTEKAINMIDPKPVFCSHRSSDQAGMRERAATAALHAKLMPVMKDFITNVNSSMEKLTLRCPLSIVTGSGATIEPETAVRQSGETVASGPACTALFGARFSKKTGLVIDVGGTTTDIAMIKNGQPVLSPEGCIIDSWVTHMPSVDMYTGGIGGDSLVYIDKNGSISIGPNRVFPLAMSSDTATPEAWLGIEDKSRGISLTPNVNNNATIAEDHILSFLQTKGTATIFDLKQETGLSSIPIDRQLEQLTREQKVQETGFTPTDALHALGLAEFGDCQKARVGAATLATEIGLNVDTFCNLILEKTEEEIISLILNYVINRSWGNSLSGFISSHKDHPILKTEFSLKIPLIGIGAAAKFFLPRVASKLSTTVSFPEFCEVGNAIGAAATFQNNAEPMEKN